MQIQCAKKEHAGMISKLIYSTEEDPQGVWGDGTKEEILGRLNKLVKRTDTRYSYEHARVAVCDGQVCGAMVALSHQELTVLDTKTEKMIFRWQDGFWAKLRWIVTAFKGMSLKESAPGEYYIANVATFAWVRGKGIGTKLLLDAEKRAREHGLDKCSLIVDQSKPAVVELYSGLGYEVDSEELLDTQKYYRMVKAL